MQFSIYDDGKEDLKTSKIYYFISNISRCDTRDALLDWFTARDRPLLNILPKEVKGENIIIVEGDPVEIEELKKHVAFHVPVDNNKGDLFELTPPESGTMWVYATDLALQDANKLVLFKLQNDATQPAFHMYDQFMLDKGMIDNYTGEPIKTDIGKFFLNELLFVKAFGDKVPYLNGLFKPGDLGKLLSKLLLDGAIGREQYNIFMNNLYWFGSDGSIFISTFTERSLGIDPAILKKRDELFEQYKDQLSDPIVMSKIEQELVRLDKEYMKGDKGADYYDAIGGKSYSDFRKKIWITFGVTGTFGDNENKYTSVNHSLDEGFTAETLPAMANVLRRGSYSRSMETAKGGDLTKYMLRVFQNVTIDEEDCHTKKGLPIQLTENNKKLYINRWLVDGTLLTAENINQYVGKTIEVRSPMYCKSKPGLCYKCCGELFRKLQMKAVGLNELVISSVFMYVAMKTFHSTGVNSTRISDFKKFLR